MNATPSPVLDTPTMLLGSLTRSSMTAMMRNSYQASLGREREGMLAYCCMVREQQQLAWPANTARHKYVGGTVCV